jgi:RHS repeat-associated protein
MAHCPAGSAYHLPDALGSVRQMADPDAAAIFAQSYEPYGNVLGVSGESRTPYGFAGEWMDRTGLMHLRARYYAPYFGAFVQPDPWGGEPSIPSTMHEYLYALNNPVINVDPSGQVVCLYGIDPATGECRARPEGLPWWLQTPSGPLGVVSRSVQFSPGGYLQYVIYAALACTPYLAQYVREAAPAIPGQISPAPPIELPQLEDPPNIYYSKRMITRMADHLGFLFGYGAAGLPGFPNPFDRHDRNRTNDPSVNARHIRNSLKGLERNLQGSDLRSYLRETLTRHQYQQLTRALDNLLIDIGDQGYFYEQMGPEVANQIADLLGEMGYAIP